MPVNGLSLTPTTCRSVILKSKINCIFRNHTNIYKQYTFFNRKNLENILSIENNKQVLEEINAHAFLLMFVTLIICNLFFLNLIICLLITLCQCYQYIFICSIMPHLYKRLDMYTRFIMEFLTGFLIQLFKQYVFLYQIKQALYFSQ